MMINVSTHRPIVATLTVRAVEVREPVNHFRHINWQKIKSDKVLLFKSELENVLDTVSVKFADSYSHTGIDNLYNSIVDCISLATESCLPRVKFRPFLKPYWNQGMKDRHAFMRLKRRNWLAAGRPRDASNSSLVAYKDAKRLFRSHHRTVVANYINKIHRDIDSADVMDNGLFWKLFNRKRSSSPILQSVNFSLGAKRYVTRIRYARSGEITSRIYTAIQTT